MTSIQIGMGVPLLIRANCAPDIGVDRDKLLEHFVERCHSFGLENPDEACPKIVQLLPTILTDHYFVSTVIPEAKGRHTAYEQVGGLTVLAHHHPTSVASRPHNHGRTWAIYGVATGKTAMYDWELVEPPRKGHRGKVKLVKSYWIMPGEAHYYPIGAIHSHRTYDDSRLIRIEGVNIRRRNLKIGGRNFDPIGE